MQYAPSLLLVDDEPELLSLVEHRFRQRGYRVRACDNVVAALAAARQESFDAAVLDRNVRGEDGLQLAQLLQLIHPQLRIIILSGHAEPPDRTDSGEWGVLEYMTKPCGFKDLENAVEIACLSIAEAYKGEVLSDAVP
jgi:two-component system, OmpR family, phosphate regulon response regulator PhoB